MDIATLTVGITTDLTVAATLIIQVSRAVTERKKRDLVALVWIWVGTVLLVIVAIPEVAPVFLTGADGARLMADGALLTVIPDKTQVLRYYRYAVPAMAAISGGMFLQGWSICKGD